MVSNVFMTTKQVHRGRVDTGEGKNLSMSAWQARVLQVARGYFTRRWDRLDLEETPNSVMRDLGFLDGHAPYREEDRMH